MSSRATNVVGHRAAQDRGRSWARRRTPGATRCLRQPELVEQVVPAEIDRRLLPIGFEGDPLAITPTEFVPAGHAWQAWRRGNLDAGRCGLSSINELSTRGGFETFREHGGPLVAHRRWTSYPGTCGHSGVWRVTGSGRTGSGRRGPRSPRSRRGGSTRRQCASASSRACRCRDRQSTSVGYIGGQVAVAQGAQQDHQEAGVRPSTTRGTTARAASPWATSARAAARRLAASSAPSWATKPSSSTSPAWRAPRPGTSGLRRVRGRSPRPPGQ